MSTKKRRLKKSVKIALGIIIALLVLVVGFFVWRMMKPKVEEPVPTPTPTPTSTPTPTPSSKEYELKKEKLMELHDEYETNHEINDEVVGTLYFNSGIIHQPVVYDPTNNKYIRTNWETMEYDPVGSAFMDFRNDVKEDDQNTIIYGHYVYESYSKDRTLMFTPIDLFREEKNYEPNKYITFVTEDEVRYYQLAVIFDCPLIVIDDLQYTPEELQYNLIDYEEGYFELYTNNLKQYEFYDTGVPLEPSDHLLTLQTCVEGREDKRLVAIAKEITRFKYEEVRDSIEAQSGMAYREMDDLISDHCPFEVIEIKKEKDGRHYIGEENELILLVTDDYEDHIDPGLSINNRDVSIEDNGTVAKWYVGTQEHILTVKQAFTDEEWDTFLKGVIK